MSKLFLEPTLQLTFIKREIRKILTDFGKKVETGMDPRLLFTQPHKLNLHAP